MSDEKNNPDEKKKLDKKNMSDYEYISDLTTIAGQEKRSFDSVVNWTLMVNLAGFGFLISLIEKLFSGRQIGLMGLFCPEELNLTTVYILLCTISILMVVTFVFAIRAWHSFRNYYRYCNARYDELTSPKKEGTNSRINKWDTRGKPLKKPRFKYFLLGTEFPYLIVFHLILYLIVLGRCSIVLCYLNLLTTLNLCWSIMPIIIAVTVAVIYWSIAHKYLKKCIPLKDCS